MTPDEIVSANIRRLYEGDERTMAELARDAADLYPDRSPEAWRKMLERAPTVWPSAEVIAAIAEIFDVEVHVLYMEDGIEQPPRKPKAKPPARKWKAAR